VVVSHSDRYRSSDEVARAAPSEPSTTTLDPAAPAYCADLERKR
jgi:hypothetical protein